MQSLGEHFNEAIRRDGAGSAAALKSLNAAIKRDHIVEIVDGCEMFPRPAFLTGAEVADVERNVVDLFDLLVSIPDRLFGGDAGAMCDALGVGPVERAAIGHTWTDRDVLLGRADLYRDESGFKLLEFNVHSSTGGLEIADLNRTMLQVPFFHDFVTREHLTFTDTMDGVAEALWSAARRRGLGSRPVVAVVDWHTTFHKYERSLRRISGLLVDRGFDAFPCHLRQMRCDGGRLLVGDRQVDILYRIFLIDDLQESPADIIPLLEAHRAGTVLLAMSFVAELIGNKGTIALLSDPIHRHHFSLEEQALIDRFIPHTRFVRSGTTWWDGREVEVLDLLRERQDDLVLKPVIGYGGLGVQVGWKMRRDEWETAVERAARGPVLYVLQERVRPVPESMPRLTPHGVRFDDVVLNWGVYVANGRYNGAMVRGTRARGHGVINVMQGAAMGCCFQAASA